METLLVDKATTETTGTATPPTQTTATAEQAAKGTESAAAPAKASENAAESAFDIKVPDGKKLDDSYLKDLKEFATANKLGPEAAQKAFERDLAREQKRQASFDASWAAQKKSWNDEIDKDPEMGGANRAASDARVFEVVDRIWGKEFRERLVNDGLDLEPAFRRGLNKLATMGGESKTVVNGRPSLTGDTGWESAFPNSGPDPAKRQ